MSNAFAFNAEDGSTMARRQKVLMEAQGYYAETYPSSASSAVATMVSGTIYFQAIGLAVGDIVTNIITRVHTAGATFSGIGMKVGLYTKAGVLLASSADVSTAHSSTGAKVSALALQSNGTPYQVTATDGYFLAALAIATTPPVMVRSFQNGVSSKVGSNQALTGVQTAQTDLPANATITNPAATEIQFWMGVS